MPRFQIYACVVAVILIGWAALICAVPSMSLGRLDEDFAEIPTSIAGWEGSDTAADAVTLRALPTASVLNREYVNGDTGERVNLSVVYGQDLGDLHQPEICMRGAGWNATSSDVIELNPKQGTPHQVSVVTLTNGIQEIVMLYWFYIGDGVAPTMGQRKLSAFTDAMLKALVSPVHSKELKASAMVKFTALVDVNQETATNTSARLAELLDEHIMEMTRQPVTYVPSDVGIE